MYAARGIDHVVQCVRDLDLARSFYERLGFTLTPPAQHPFGTGNSLVQMKGSFLELLTVMAPQDIAPHAPNRFSFGAFNKDFLARREGFSMLVFEGKDAPLDARGFAQRGLQTYAPFDFQREAELPDGSSVTVGFSLAFVTDPRMPEVAFFTCQQHAPEHFWKPDYQRHINGAQDIAEVVMVADAPKTLQGLFAGIQGPDAVKMVDGNLHVSGPLGRVVVLTPDALAARYPDIALPGDPAHPHFVGYRIVVENLDRAAAILRDREVGFQSGSDRIWLDPAECFNCLVEFSGAA